MGLHQYVQRRNAIGYAVGIAIFLCQIAGHGHIKLRRQQKSWTGFSTIPMKS